jgi:SAM-dependent methyltransferase
MWLTSVQFTIHDHESKMAGCEPGRLRYHMPMRFRRLLVCLSGAFLVLGLTAAASPQLGSRPAEEWIKTLDGPTRVAALKIDEVVAAIKLQPGQTVADIGAGTGLLEAPLAKAVGPSGRVYAVEIDAGFFPTIRKRAADANITNVETVLGQFTDPKLPVKNVDVALFHDVIHHVEKRADYLKTLAGYLAPRGRIVVVDYEPGKGPHSGHTELEVSREQLATWMRDAGLQQTDDVKLFADKYILVFSKR